TLMPEAFASVGDMFGQLVDQTSDNIADFSTIDESYVVYGETKQSSTPYYDNPSLFTHKSSVVIGSDTVELPISLKSVGGIRDRLFYDTSDSQWKVEQLVSEFIFDADYTMADNGSVYFRRISDKKVHGQYISTHFTGDGTRPWQTVPVGSNELIETVEAHRPNPQSYTLVGIYPDRSIWATVGEFNEWLATENVNGTPVSFLYERSEPIYIELDESTQDVLNSYMRE